ncbi:MAG: hypothetical protein LBK03_03385, partial [Bacteroidales bacterium]|nr:hypothetical protein [Bacteroidales bacterium]
YNPVSTEPETTYKEGDLYSVSGVKGIVFAVSADKKHGSILAIESITATQYKWATVKEVTGATDTLDGAKNMAAIKTMANWATNYPAFKYWDAKGFYIPAKNELRTIFNNYTTIKTAVEKEGGSFNFTGSSGGNSIFASTEANQNECTRLFYSNGVVGFMAYNKVVQGSDLFILGVKKF